jgi:teichuronic acid exporter
MTSPSTEASRSLDRSLVHGIAWTAAARWVTQVFSWASTLVVARLLSPADYGLVGMAAVFTGLIQIVNEFGLGAAIVRTRDLDESQRAALGGFSVALGVVFFLLSAALAVPIGEFFGERAVAGIVLVLATNFVISGRQVLPAALLFRELAFSRIAQIDVGVGLVQAAITLTLALAGLRYWSLVLGTLISSALSLALYARARPHRIAFPRDLRRLREPLLLGWQVTVSRMAWYGFSNADFAVVGRVLGKAALGAYSFGWQMASIPVDRVSAVLSRVTLPIFSAAQHDLPTVRRYVVLLTELLALIAMPLSIGLAVVADDFVLVLVGPRWANAISPLRLLAVYAGFRCLTTFFPQVLTAVGQARWNMRVGLVMLVVMPLAFVVGARWGTSGVAVAWIVAYPLVTVPGLLLRMLRSIELSGREYISALRPAFTSTAAMAAVTVSLSVLLPNGWGHAVRLVVLVCAGAIAYLSVLWLAHRERVSALVAVVRGLRHRAKPLDHLETAQIAQRPPPT